MIDLAAVTPNLLANTTDNWPANDVWNYAKWDDDATNKSILKDGEDEDHMGNQGFHKLVNFALGIIVKDDEAYGKLAAVLPNVGDFKKLNVV